MINYHHLTIVAAVLFSVTAFAYFTTVGKHHIYALRDFAFSFIIWLFDVKHNECVEEYCHISYKIDIADSFDELDPLDVMIDDWELRFRGSFDTAPGYKRLLAKMSEKTYQIYNQMAKTVTV